MLEKIIKVNWFEILISKLKRWMSGDEYEAKRRKLLIWICNKFAELEKENKRVTRISMNFNDFSYIRKYGRDMYDPAVSVESINSGMMGYFWGTEIRIDNTLKEIVFSFEDIKICESFNSYGPPAANVPASGTEIYNSNMINRAIGYHDGLTIEQDAQISEHCKAMVKPEIITEEIKKVEEKQDIKKINKIDWMKNER